MKIKFWTFAHNCGDGSVSVRLFASEKEAQDSYQKDEDEYGENYNDSVSSHTIEVDESGNIISGMWKPF